MPHCGHLAWPRCFPTQRRPVTPFPKLDQSSHAHFQGV
jgi:hypothetical protein